jgi:hypothetical protein
MMIKQRFVHNMLEGETAWISDGALGHDRGRVMVRMDTWITEPSDKLRDVRRYYHSIKRKNGEYIVNPLVPDETSLIYPILGYCRYYPVKTGPEFNMDRLAIYLTPDEIKTGQPPIHFGIGSLCLSLGPRKYYIRSDCRGSDKDQSPVIVWRDSDGELVFKWSEVKESKHFMYYNYLNGLGVCKLVPIRRED